MKTKANRVHLSFVTRLPCVPAPPLLATHLLEARENLLYTSLSMKFKIEMVVGVKVKGEEPE